MLQSLGSQRVGHNLVTEQQQHQQKQVAGCRTSRLCWHSNASSCGWSEVNLLSHVRLFATPWIAAYQASQSMEFFRQEYWSGLPSKGTKPRKSGDGCISWFRTNNMNLCCLHFSLNMCCWKEGSIISCTKGGPVWEQAFLLQIVAVCFLRWLNKGSFKEWRSPYILPRKRT